jgi:hypothetical protein
MNDRPIAGQVPARRRRSAPDPLDPHGDIALCLRALFAAVEQEPIPEALIDLLDRLDEAERNNRA